MKLEYLKTWRYKNEKVLQISSGQNDEFETTNTQNAAINPKIFYRFVLFMIRKYIKSLPT